MANLKKVKKMSPQLKRELAAAKKRKPAVVAKRTLAPRKKAPALNIVSGEDAMTAAQRQLKEAMGSRSAGFNFHFSLPAGVTPDQFTSLFTAKDGGEAFSDAIRAAVAAQELREVERRGEVVDNGAVDLLADAMRTRLAEKRGQGYAGWNDPLQCDQRRLAEAFVNKVMDCGNPVDLANFLCFIYAGDLNGDGGRLIYQEVERRVGVLREADLKTIANLQETVKRQTAEAGMLRAQLNHVGGDLERAKGYIDRVNELDVPAPFQGEQSRVGDIERTEVRVGCRGPRFSQDLLRDRDGEARAARNW